MSKDYHYDYLVIGSGIAGLSAALKLSKYGTTAIITKASIHESATNLAQGGIAAAMTKNDAPDYHFDDTLKAGDGLCDELAVKILVEEGPDRVRELIALGANFDKIDGDYDYTKEAAHSKRRILHVGDATGREIKKTLGNAVLKEPLAKFFPLTFVKELIIENGECIGCIAIHNHAIIRFYAKATIIATGGCGQLFARNTNPPIATGDGIALAYRAGCLVQDMEFVQFHPTTLALGDKKPISIFLITEALRGEGAILRNIHGERFMTQYHPDAELAPRDIVARSIYRESQKTKNNVYLDLSPITQDLPKRFPTIYERCMECGIDITREFIPVSPAAHYFMGGIQTNVHGQTKIPRLYAAGETASLGLHGANRLASNSLLDGLVFGHKSALKMYQEPPLSSLPATINTKKLSTNIETSSKIKAARHAIKSIMWRQVSIIRNKTDLESATSDLNALNWILEINTNDDKLLEVQNMLTVSKLIVSSALQREESRGAHFRADFPEKNPHWKRRIIL
jgi:L-aspartate oxidase